MYVLLTCETCYFQLHTRDLRRTILSPLLSFIFCTYSCLTSHIKTLRVFALSASLVALTVPWWSKRRWMPFFHTLTCLTGMKVCEHSQTDSWSLTLALFSSDWTSSPIFVVPCHHMCCNNLNMRDKFAYFLPSTVVCWKAKFVLLADMTKHINWRCGRQQFQLLHKVVTKNLDSLHC